jgi:spermidine synthase
LALALWCASRVWPRRATSGIAAAAALALTLLAVPKQTLIEDIAINTSNPMRGVAQVVENRSGIIHVFRNGTGDATYGNNVYDGRINTDLRINSNGVNRVYILAALHPAPRRVLVVGLSSGAWTAILSRMPGVEHIDVVEINPGYIDVIRRYAAVNAILDDSRIAIHFDDGRRWLRRNSGAMYDMIVMNTTWYWRVYSSNLLSAEFLREVKRHLRPGGLVMYNSTGSPDVFHTAAMEFSFVRKYENFVYAADHDFVAAMDENRERVWSFGLPGPPVFDRASTEDQKAIDAMMARDRFQTVAAVQRSAGRPLEVITDDNLLTEYKYGRSWIFLPGFH